MACRVSLFAGMSREQLQQALAATQDAYIQLRIESESVPFSD